MKLREWLSKWKLTSLKVNAKFLEMEFSLQDDDKKAAWDMYIELLTRITTQRLPMESGDEKTALDSVYSLFPTTRSILKERGRDCQEFSKIAIIVLNQIIRPFTAKWHRQSEQGAFSNPERCNEFRTELEQLQNELMKYSQMLADMAGVEDLTSLEQIADDSP